MSELLLGRKALTLSQARVLQLAAQGLLQHSVVVLLSDHGVTLGEHHDRIIDTAHYRGAASDLRRVQVAKLATAPEFTLDFKHDYALDASYGQGSDVLSLKQYQVVLAVKGFGVDLPKKQVRAMVSLIDLAPTVLDYLHLAPLARADGVSWKKYFSQNNYSEVPHAFYIETGDRILASESNQINVSAVVQSAVNAYLIEDGLVMLSPQAEKSIIKGKQRAVMMNGWLLARFPEETQYRLRPDVMHVGQMKFEPVVSQPYFVLVNLQTGLWTIGLNSAFARKAPVGVLMREFQRVYGSEV